MSYPIRPNILRMQPYPPGKPIEEVQRELGLTDVVKLASNENPVGASRMAIEAMKAAAEEVHLYPDARGYSLKQKLAEIHDLSPDHIMLGCGSDEIIGVLGNLFLEPGTELLMPDPSFMRYDAAANLNAAKLVKVPLDSNFNFDVQAILSAVTGSTRLIFLANPNNPTGTLLRKDQFESLLSKLPGNVVVVLDEAYHEYVDRPEYPDSLSYIRAGAPVVSLRTFSKAYGLAGIRVGYGFADPEIVKSFNAARSPFDINSLALAGAEAALSDFDHLARTLQVNREGMTQIVEAAHEMGLKTVPSQANFVCIKVGDSKEVTEKLLHLGVIVRPGVQLGMPEHIRVSIGTKAQNDRFISALKQSLPKGVPA